MALSVDKALPKMGSTHMKEKNLLPLGRGGKTENARVASLESVLFSPLCLTIR